MDYLYEKVVRPIFFRFDPEVAHNRALTGMKLLGKLGPIPRLMERRNMIVPGARPVEAFGLKFPNRVGLAAGYDKLADVWPVCGALGFGHAEIGTITQHAQPGNEGPRVFRYPQYEAVVNRYGFPNIGADATAAKLAKGPKKGARTAPLGINIGKSKKTELADAPSDYLYSFAKLAEYADYMVVNISSPNTPGLRQLQDKDHLVTLLNELMKANRERAAKLGEAPVPFLLKIAPDLTFGQMDEILGVVADSGFAGIIATNTTLDRPASMPELNPAGGLSGKPLLEKSLGVVKYLVKASGGKIPVIGSGGICQVADAGRFIDEGAVLVQLYSGLVYRGPFFPRDCARALAWHDTQWV